MIEFCSKKRMIAAVLLLTSISIAVIIIENRLPVGHEMHDTVDNAADVDNDTKRCYENGGEIEIIERCRACSDFRMKSVPKCQVTSYVEKVLCRTKEGGAKDFTRSCRRSGRDDEQRFWLFEFITALVGALSYVVVHVRQKRLDRLLMEKVHRQIASGV